jgi:hypothetical protein
MLRGLQLAQPRQQAESHADRKAIEAPRKHALGWLCSAGSPSRLLLRVVVACHDSNHDSPIEKGATARSSQGQNEARESTRDHHAVRVRRCYRPRLDKLEPQNVRHFGHSRALRLPDLPSRDRGRRLQRHSEQPSRRVRMRLQGHRGRPCTSCAVKQANEKAWTQCCVCQQQWGSELLVCLARECHKLCEEHTAPDDTHDGGARAAVHFDPDRGDAHHGRFGTDQAAR